MNDLLKNMRMIFIFQIIYSKKENTWLVKCTKCTRDKM